MKLTIFFLISIVISSSLSRDSKPENIDDLFTKFAIHHKTSFKSKTDFLLRKKIFSEKLQKIEDHNKKFDDAKESFREDLNEFSLLTLDEMRAMTLGDIGEPKNEGKIADEHLKRRKRDATTPPLSWDWRTKGVVRDVRHQGSCGSCYAYAAIGAIESRMQIVHEISTDLSEEEAVACTNICNGGWDYDIYNYAIINNGCAAYTSTQASTSTCVLRSTRVAESKVKDYFYVPKNESEIRYYLYNKGPLSAVMKVYDNFYSYSSGVYSTASGNYVGIHAVLLVGYGTEGGIDYWLVKNSWGASWAMSGYFKIKRGVNLCRIEDYLVSYPEV